MFLLMLVLNTDGDVPRQATVAKGNELLGADR